MYLAALPPFFSAVSTYFIAAIDMVGGGGITNVCQTFLHKQANKNQQT